MSKTNRCPPFISACQGLSELTLKINTEDWKMAILLSASALGAPDLLKLRNQTAAYWAAHH